MTAVKVYFKQFINLADDNISSENLWFLVLTRLSSGNTPCHCSIFNKSALVRKKRTLHSRAALPLLSTADSRMERRPGDIIMSGTGQVFSGLGIPMVVLAALRFGSLRYSWVLQA